MNNTNTTTTAPATNTANVVKVAELIQCPHCPCAFFSKKDLRAHLDFFGDKPHEQYWLSVHRQADYGIGGYY